MKSADGSQLSLYRPTCLANFFSALRLRRANHKNLQLKGVVTPLAADPRRGPTSAGDPPTAPNSKGAGCVVRRGKMRKIYQLLEKVC